MFFRHVLKAYLIEAAMLSDFLFLSVVYEFSYLLTYLQSSSVQKVPNFCFFYCHV